MSDPEFVHDCDECVFLGTLRRAETVFVTDEVAAALTAHIEDGKASIADLHAAIGMKPAECFDFYFCDKADGIMTVIARYGSDGESYKSGLLAAEHDEDLKLALKLAQARGLLPICGVTDADDEAWDG